MTKSNESYISPDYALTANLFCIYNIFDINSNYSIAKY